MKVNYWFRANKRGIGWVPQTWHGHMVVILYLVSLGYSFLKADEVSDSATGMLYSFIPKLLIFTAILVIVTYLTGEPIALGSKKDDQPKAP